MNDNPNYKQMIEMRHNWDLAGIEEFQLDSLRIDTLANIADTARGMAGAMARGLLEFAYGYHFPTCIACGNQNKDSKLDDWNTTGNKPAKIQLSVSPNPANTWVRFKYELKNQAVIVVHNNSGQSVAEIALNPGKKEYVWDTRALASGLYYYIMEANGQISSGSFIINH